jgi:hypothetical protein
MNLWSTAGLVVVALLIAETANLVLRKRQTGRSHEHHAKPSLKHAVALLAFAVVFAILKWAEHVWRLGREDYAGVGLRHTWYWTATTWVALAACLGRLAWLALLGWRRLTGAAEQGDEADER